MDRKPLLIGQAPGPSSNPAHPLLCLPASSAGGRLQRFSGLSRTQYLRLYERTNLLRVFPGSLTGKPGDLFPPKMARQAANELRPSLEGRTVVFVGRGVAEAFGHDELPFFQWGLCPLDDFYYAAVPHPSGLSRAYNSAEARQLLAEVMRRAVELARLPFGRRHPMTAIAA